MDLKESLFIGDDLADHWYYRSKARAMLRLLGERNPGTVLDVGAGSGFFSRHLLRSTRATDAWCVDTGYETSWDSHVSGKLMRFRRSIDNCSADLLLMMDVLEHVDDDSCLLQDYVRRLRPGGIALISVPAFQWLWSDHDEFLEHRRRYTLTQIERVVSAAGLRNIMGVYYFGAVLPIAVISRMPAKLRLKQSEKEPRSQLVRHSRVVNELLAALCNAELPLMRGNRCGGLTALCLASKP